MGLLELEWKRQKIEWLCGCLGSSSSSGSETCLTVTEICDFSFDGECTWAGWLDGETTVAGVFGEGVGDAEERGESSEVSHGYASISTSSDSSGVTGTGMGFGLDGKPEAWS